MAEIERELYGDDTPAVRTKKIFENSSAMAAHTIIDLVANGANDSIRLRAASYVVDRVLGPVGKDDQQDALNEFLSGIEKLANQEK